MERAEHQMSCLRGLDGDRHRFEVTHLSDKDDVGVLTQRRPQSSFERLRVTAHLPLGDDALLVRMHELDRILDCYDVVCSRPVDEVYQGSECGRFAAPGGAGHHD